jgi:hypothetical protein
MYYNSHYEFSVWLRGFLDALGDSTLTSEQLEVIKAKLNTLVVYDTSKPTYRSSGIRTVDLFPYTTS